MEGYAECQVCSNGYLLPFYGSDGTCVYFCSSCRSRFSGYAREPTIDGLPIFSKMAKYSIAEEFGMGGSSEVSDLMESYRSLMDQNPPQPKEDLIMGYHRIFERNPPTSGRS